MEPSIETVSIPTMHGIGPSPGALGLDEAIVTGSPSQPIDESSNRSVADDKNIPAFVTKLLAMINDSSTNHLISWTEVSRTEQRFDDL